MRVFISISPVSTFWKRSFWFYNPISFVIRFLSQRGSLCSIPFWFLIIYTVCSICWVRHGMVFSEIAAWWEMKCVPRTTFPSYIWIFILRKWSLLSIPFWFLIINTVCSISWIRHSMIFSEITAWWEMECIPRTTFPSYIWVGALVKWGLLSIPFWFLIIYTVSSVSWIWHSMVFSKIAAWWKMKCIPWTTFPCYIRIITFSKWRLLSIPFWFLIIYTVSSICWIWHSVVFSKIAAWWKMKCVPWTTLPCNIWVGTLVKWIGLSIPFRFFVINTVGSISWVWHGVILSKIAAWWEMECIPWTAFPCNIWILRLLL